MDDFARRRGLGGTDTERARAWTLLAVYQQTLGFGFVNFDDPLYISSNPHIADGLTWEGLRWAFFSRYVGTSWHPLLWINFMLDVEVFGLSAWWSHLENVLLHLANTLLVYAVFSTATGRSFNSAVVAALFALHPLNVESVAWACERKNTLSMLFFLIACYSYVQYARSKSKLWHMTVAVTFFLGLLSKPSVVVFPVMLLLLDIWPLRRIRKIPGTFLRFEFDSGIITEKILLFVLSAAVVAINIADASPSSSRLVDVQVPQRIANAIISTLDYVQKTIVPANLAAYYPFPQHMPPWHVAVSLGVIAAITLLACLTLSSAPFLFAGWCWFLVGLAPVTGIIPYGEWMARADRFAYSPCIGLFIMAAWGAASLCKKSPRALGMGLALSILLPLTLLTYAQIQTWRDTRAVFTNCATVTRCNWLAYQNLGSMDKESGNVAAALENYNKLIHCYPDYAETYYNLGNLYYSMDNKAAAMDNFRTAMEKRPNFMLAMYNLCIVSMEMKQFDEARALISSLRGIDPFNAQYRITAEAIELAATNSTQ